MRILLEFFKTTLLVASLLISTIGFSKTTPKEKELVNAVFDFAENKNQVRKLQIRLVLSNEIYIASVKAMLSNGSTQSGQVQCEKKKSDEYFCRRDDDGGSFTLQTGKVPKLTYTCFATAEEGSTNPAAIGCVDTKPITVEGKSFP